VSTEPFDPADDGAQMSFDGRMSYADRQVDDGQRRWWSHDELPEKLVDVEDDFRRWRFNHVTTVERVIGFERGTGGTGGVSYLRRMLDVELFPDLWSAPCRRPEGV
jgi:tryptophan 2,3-dioxygenase